ncbi:hypothetical protein C8R14_12910 [Nitrosomonas eutropha]|uniref:Uncharacterized protein n=1 Tax=Nitrosomonas eutropha TaxID=916 RepID=A0ABX5M4L7_9PROT|nr:hypothetical protein C8R14_12910 [Nitrosomonas eutropha]
MKINQISPGHTELAAGVAQKKVDRTDNAKVSTAGKNNSIQSAHFYQELRHRMLAAKLLMLRKLPKSSKPLAKVVSR